MGMWSYVLDIEDGAAPNPFYGYCTLAICKPSIRRKAAFGDWIIGTGNSRIGNNKLIYAMKVTESMDFQHYFEAKRFQNKKPRFNNKDNHCHLGDNIYKPGPEGFKQMPSVHSNGNNENLNNKLHDLGNDLRKNNRVLISDNFYYFGNQAPELPSNLKGIVKKGQAHKSISISNEEISLFEKFITQFQKGINGKPNDLLTPKDILDTSCTKFNKTWRD